VALMTTASNELYDIKLHRLDGTPASLRDFAGDVLLIVNVASECGLTPQYEGLQQLYDREKARGFEVLGFPCNQFGAQEPGNSEQIATFCKRNYGVTFPLFEKVEVNGSQRHPLYSALIGDGGDITWNFEKFLVDREGNVVDRFSPNVTPEDPALQKTIDSALNA
jgi:glutathione peroxidase